MARVPFLDVENHPELNDTIARICAPRAKQYPNGLEPGKHLWKLYTTLLHSPPVADGWAHLVTAVRQDIKVPIVDQELVIVLLAKINKSRFEYNTHAPKGLAAGLSKTQLEALPNWRESKEFNDRQRAILAYADTMTRTVEVPDEVFEAVRPLFDTRQLVELTALIATYNFTMRYTVAMQLGE